MIKAAILAHPEDSRTGVSRPLLKKWIHAKYAHTAALSDAAFASRLSRAIASGETKKLFVLPKGPSGKVKLAPGAKPKPAKAKPAKDGAQDEKDEKDAAPKKPKGEKKKAAGPKKPATAAKKDTPKKPAAKKDAAPKKAAAKKDAAPKKPAAKKAAASADK